LDIKTGHAQPSADERAAVDALLGPPASGWEGGPRDGAGRDGRVAYGGLAAVRERRHLLLPALHALQDRVGWISPGGLDYVCQRLTVPPAEAWGVATFYHLFATSPRPRRVLHVCEDLACRLAGAETLCGELEATVGPPDTHCGEGSATWLRSPCLGQCERGPAVLLLEAGAPARREVLTALPGTTALLPLLTSEPNPRPTAPASASDSADPAAARLEHVRRSVPEAGNTDLRLLARVGLADPESLTSYRAHGGYRALDRALALGPSGVIAEITAAKLLGRGGAAFPTGRKWEAVARAGSRTRYLVCNADESEPGTFKDRILLEEDPFSIVEAMTIAGFAVGAERGFVYLRGEYPQAERRLAGAIAQAHDAGLLGRSVAGAAFRFDLEIRRGAGAYICGEETALFNSLEGKRGEPRSKPPFPVEVGLFGQPTVVNNVETLANVPGILLDGAAAYAAIGTPSSTGTRLFCVSGHVGRPGLYELPFGATLGTLLERAGGVRPGPALQAVLLGGAAGTFVGPDSLDMPLSFEATRAAGATLGSGVVLVYDQHADLADALVRIAAFFRDESCGQCVPCRVGTVRQEELLARLREGRGVESPATDLALYRELAQAMRDASICGLGQTASSAIESALARFDPFTDGSRPRPPQAPPGGSR
jgi:NADH-quinone oxidoreductase subunit F